jgi:acetyl-CoA carboxylase biotin carboxyl carrier protein
MAAVPDLDQEMTDLLALMDEFHLDEASLAGDDWRIFFSRLAPSAGAVAAAPAAASAPAARPAKAKKTAAPAAAKGIPVSSPMMGIYYSQSSPGTPPFVKEGDMVNAGDVVGLIEAMKVFNEITAPCAGRVGKLLVKSGDLVQPGEPILYVE